jgi:hypothetical protein
VVLGNVSSKAKDGMLYKYCEGRGLSTCVWCLFHGSLGRYRGLSRTRKRKKDEQAGGVRVLTISHAALRPRCHCAMMLSTPVLVQRVHHCPCSRVAFLAPC